MLSRIDAQRLEVAGEERRGRVHVEHARHADADVLPALPSAGCARASAGSQLRARDRVGHHLGRSGPEDVVGRDSSTKFGFASLTASRPFLMSRMSLTSSTVPFSQVAMMRRFDPGSERHLGLRAAGSAIGGLGSHLDVDEGAQALVLAEVAARRPRCGGLVGDLGHRIEADEAALLPVLVQAHRFERRADRARLAGVLVHRDVGLQPLAA